MAGKLEFSLHEYQEAAVKYRSDLLMLPITGIEETTKFMTLRPGIRTSERVGEINGDAQFAPYKPARKQDFNLKLEFRTLTTYFGSVVSEFEPNTAIGTLLGTGTTMGDGQMTTPTALHVLALHAKSLSEHLNDAIWSAVRSPDGDTTADLFDGFDTITQNEISSGTISESKGNLKSYRDTKVDASNAVDIAKEILYSLDPHLRAQDCYMYCSQSFADAYNEGYLLTHAGINYNNQFNQTTVEGSNGKLHICPLSNKPDSGRSTYIQVSPKSNMLIGCDQMGDVEKVMVKEYAPFILTYIATMFFGVQFESIDKRRLFVASFLNN